MSLRIYLLQYVNVNNDGLPIRVKFSDWSEQEYEWDGLGNHLSTTYSGVSYTGKPYTKLIRKYTGDGRVIDNGVEIYERYPGGYMQDSTYCFYVRDYQGNNLAVMDGDKKLIQQTDYYPYGEPWREPTGQPWLYSGNERLRVDGINEYDFNARRFNSAEGQFSSWDLLTEKRPWESPYSFCGGDPVNHSDPTGNHYNVNIDPEAKEITIAAVYYAFSEDVESAKKAVAFPNIFQPQINIMIEYPIKGKLVCGTRHVSDELTRLGRILRGFEGIPPRGAMAEPAKDGD